MNKLEARLTTDFSKFVSSHYTELPPFIFEAKAVNLDKKISCGLCEFKPHQLPNLRKGSTTGVYWKIPDLGSLNPFDGFFFRGEAWVIIFWYMPRKMKKATIIRIQDFDKFFDGVTKKSIRFEEACEVAFRIIDL